MSRDIDAAKSRNFAGENLGLAAKAKALMKAAHTDDPNWPMRESKPGAAMKAKKMPPPQLS